VRTIEIIEAVRARGRRQLSVILVPNRVDASTLEGQQIASELNEFGHVVSSTSATEPHSFALS
jgi:ABC-type Na+ efflux pump permease subunit